MIQDQSFAEVFFGLLGFLLLGLTISVAFILTPPPLTDSGCKTEGVSCLHGGSGITHIIKYINSSSVCQWDLCTCVRVQVEVYVLYKHHFL